MSKEEHEESSLRNADNLHTITPDSGSNDVAKELSQRPSLEERLATKMFSYAREISCFCLVITFTALAALHSSPPKVSKPPPPKPFFSQNSAVVDFYEGHLGAMIDRAIASDFSFVMYYAPWDAESQIVRDEFEKVAQYFEGQIFFAAINCWHPSSECRTEYNKIQSYPVLVLYPAREAGIQYKGIKAVPYMIHFLSTAINPIIRITHKDQLAELLVNYDAVVVGYFNFTGLDKTPGYKEFYEVSIWSLERDPNREIAYCIITDAASSELQHQVFKFPSLSLFMWNESLRYPEDRDWTSENILSWVSTSIHQPTTWLQPPGIKALTLAPFLRKGPVLLLFTPRNPLHAHNYNYDLLRSVGLQYLNCADNLVTRNLIEQLQIMLQSAINRHSQRDNECTKLLRENMDDFNEPALSLSIQQWINDSCCANVVMNKCSICKKKVSRSMGKESPICALVSDKLVDVCKGIDIFKVPLMEDIKEKYEVCCTSKGQITLNLRDDLKSKRREGLSNKNDDPRSTEAVRQAFFKQRCKKWLAGNKYQQPIFPQFSTNHSHINLTDAICKVNKSLALIGIDSLHYFHFAESLGIDILNKKDKTAVVILDPAHESQYLMHDDLNQYTLVEFINNYIHGVLPRNLRSNNSKRFAQKLKTKVSCERKSTRSTCIPELKTETFLDTVLDPRKDVVVMYHSSYCAFCSAVSYVYLTVAHYLREMDHLLFVRVDGDNNDLPWEYNMNRFPSILFFPAKRKEDSMVYPFSVPITIPNLINFVLANLDGDSHVEALVNICQSGAGEPPDRCIARTRWLCLDIIQQLLHDYRKLIRHLSFLDKTTSRNNRKIILLKLEHIKDIHLLLSSTIDLTQDQHKVQLIRKKYKKYYRTLRLVELGSKLNHTQTGRTFSKEKLGFSTEKDRVKSEL